MRRIETTIAQFWSHIRPGASCWLWRGPVWGSNGYGRMTFNGRRQKAHRIIYQMLGGIIPPGYHVLHRCDQPRCVNPEHLFLGTHADNMADLVSKGRARNWCTGVAQCKRGHVFTPDNTRLDGRGRQCRACDRIRRRRRHNKQTLTVTLPEKK